MNRAPRVRARATPQKGKSSSSRFAPERRASFRRGTRLYSNILFTTRQDTRGQRPPRLLSAVQGGMPLRAKRSDTATSGRHSILPRSPHSPECVHLQWGLLPLGFAPPDRRLAQATPTPPKLIASLADILSMRPRTSVHAQIRRFISRRTCSQGHASRASAPNRASRCMPPIESVRARTRSGDETIAALNLVLARPTLAHHSPRAVPPSSSRTVRVRQLCSGAGVWRREGGNAEELPTETTRESANRSETLARGERLGASCIHAEPLPQDPHACIHLSQLDKAGQAVNDEAQQQRLP